MVGGCRIHPRSNPAYMPSCISPTKHMATPRGLSPLHILNSEVPGHSEVLSSRPALHPTCSVPLWGSWSPTPQAAPTAPASTRAHRTRCPPQGRVLLPASSGMQPARDVLASAEALETGDELHGMLAETRRRRRPSQDPSLWVHHPLPSTVSAGALLWPSGGTGLLGCRAGVPSSAPTPLGRPPASQPQAVSCHQLL